MDRNKNIGRTHSDPLVPHTDDHQKKKLPKWPFIILFLLLTFALVYGITYLTQDDSVESTPTENSISSSKTRDYFTQLRGNNQDTVTVMIYMCASDMETDSGLATTDLREMINTPLSDQVNVLVETGGAKQWQNSTVSNATNQIYQVTKSGIRLVKDDLSRDNMTYYSTLSAFIQYCVSNYPADRYALILWGHGGDSAVGFNYDETQPLFYDPCSMRADHFLAALEDGGCYFDFIGFDAPLTATLETAVVAAKYADYLIASQDTEPGCGWYYTGWLTTLSRNPSIPTVKLGQTIIDEFADSCSKLAFGHPATLSIIDLVELTNTVTPVLSSFFSSLNDLMYDGNYAQVSAARSKAKEFAPSSQTDQIDLIHFADSIGTPLAKRFVSALKGCIKYNYSSVANANGLSVYFPYNRIVTLGAIYRPFLFCGLSPDYIDCICNFAAIQIGGQIVSNGTGSAAGSILSKSLYLNSSDDSPLGTYTITARLTEFLPDPGTYDDYSVLYSIKNAFVPEDYLSVTHCEAYSRLLNRTLSTGTFGSITENLSGSIFNSNITSSNWLDRYIDDLFATLSPSQIMQNTDYYIKTYLDASLLVPLIKNDRYVLHLSSENWDLVQNITLKVFAANEDGYIDLGLDPTYRFDDDGDLILAFDGTWITINGQIVSYYPISEEHTDSSYTIIGRVPAILNHRRVDLLLRFSNQNPTGTVLGAQPIYKNETAALRKGLIDLKEGDSLQFICDFYTENAEFNNQYVLGSTFVTGGGLSVSKEMIPDNYLIKYTYGLTDIYNNKLWTKALNYNR